MFRYSKKIRNTCFLMVVLLIIIAFLPIGCSKPADQPAPANQTQEPAKETAADFYKGKTVTFIVPFNPGGGFDTYARLVAPYLEAELGAKSVVVENIPGGGSIIGTNKFYTSDPDGLTICIINLIGTIPSQVLNEEGVEFDLKNVEWVARIASDPQVLVVSPEGKIQAFEDFLTANTTISSTSTTGSTYVNPVAMIAAFELQSKIVTGFEGSSGTDLAVMRGDVDATMGSMSSKLSAIANGDLKPIVVINEEEVPELPGVPNAKPFAKSNEAKQIINAISSIAAAGRSIATSPGVPQERVEFLSDAFMKVLNNPELLDKAAKADMPINPLAGDELKKLIDTSFQLPEELIKALEAK